MSNDQTAVEGRVHPVTVAYLVAAFVVGFGIVGLIGIAGAARWPLIPTLMIGAAAQTVFRVGKRCWRNVLAGKHASASDDNRLLSGSSTTTLALIYAVMIPASALWYGLGWGAYWMWRSIF